jgi:ADP-heptose:LPS heptosyltransferase
MELKIIGSRQKYKIPLLGLAISLVAEASKILKRFSYRNSQQVVLISLHKIGDTIFSFPTIRFLYEQYGNNLTVVCLKSTVEIYKLLNFKVNIAPVDEKNFYFGGRIAGFKSRHVIFKLRPASIFDITGEINSVSLLAFSRVRKVYGRCSPYLKAFYEKFVIKEEIPSLHDRIFDVVKLISCDAKVSDYQNQIPMHHGVKNICIHPFAGWKAKEWNLYKFIEIAEHFSKNYVCKFVSEDRFISQDIKIHLNHHNIELVITDSLGELITQIENCDLFIGNDSGPANIASILGKKTFIIYGPVNPLYCSTKTNNSTYISKQLKCSPRGEEHYCFTNAGRDGCPSFECMNQLSITEVREGIISLINK